MSHPFVGEIVPFALHFPPRGYAVCDGRMFPVGQNQTLFEVIGANFGGDGRATFALPDLRGRVGIGTGQGPNMTERKIGVGGGVETVTLTLETTGPHGHTVTGVKAGLAPHAEPTDSFWGGSASRPYALVDPDTQMAADTFVAAPGQVQPHNNISPYLALEYCIALVGIAPPRP